MGTVGGLVKETEKVTEGLAPYWVERWEMETGLWADMGETQRGRVRRMRSFFMGGMGECF
jgi:hypothetical protein